LCKKYDISVDENVSLDEDIPLRHQDGAHLDIESFNRFMSALVRKIKTTAIPDMDIYEPVNSEIEVRDPRIHNPQEISITEFDYQLTNAQIKDSISLPFANHIVLVPSKADIVVSSNVSDVNVIVQNDIGPFAYILHASAPEAVEITLTFSFDKEIRANALFVDANVGDGGKIPLSYKINDVDAYAPGRFHPVTTNKLSVTFTLHHYVYAEDYLYPMFIRQLAWLLITYAKTGMAVSYPYTIYDSENNASPLERLMIDGDRTLPEGTSTELYVSIDGEEWNKLPYIINQTSPEPDSLSPANQFLLTVEDDANNEIVYDGIFKGEANLITDVVGDTCIWTSPHKAIVDSIILYRAVDCWHSVELVENGSPYEEGIPFDEGQYGGSNGLYFTYLYTDAPTSRFLIVPPGAKVYFKPPSSDIYVERKSTNYAYYAVTPIDLEVGENALSLLMPETGNWRALHNEQLQVQYLHRYIDGQAERLIPIPIHHFPEVMSAYPRMRLADGYYDDPIRYMTQFSLSQEPNEEGGWSHSLRLFEHEQYPKLKPENETLWMRYRYIGSEEFTSTLYVKAVLSTRDRYVTPIVSNIKAINNYW